jgi:putative CocE/NonD family hydrolase
MTRRFLCVVLAISLSAALGAVRAEEAAADDAAKVSVHWDVRIPMRDGIHLDATLYAPKAQQGPAPCVFTLTPYMAGTYHERGLYFAAQGLPFLLVDDRGRGNSEGEFRQYAVDAQDGYDIVEWLARQPYCNGKVGMWGGSYSGFNQWAVAKEAPPHLATIVPAAAVYPGVDSPFRGSIFYPFALQWITTTSGRTARDAVFADRAFWTSKNRQWFDTGAPFASLDGIVGDESATFQEWLQHPQPDEYWDRLTPTDAQYAKISRPILTITGSYDADQQGALTYYQRHMQRAAPEARTQHYLIIGPWDHRGTRTPSAEVGGLKLSAASLIDLPKLHVDWYRWTMQAGPKPDFLKAPVAYYVIGAEKWRYAASLSAVTESRQAYFLQSQANASDVFASGLMRAGEPARGKPDHYAYDPRDTSTSELDATASWEYLLDQRRIQVSSGKQLVYHTRPFEADTEISGFFKFEAWLAIDQPDTDFGVSIYEIAGDGSSMLLTTDQIRARYREHERTPKLIQTREPLLYTFDRFTFISRQIKKGNRLRLLIAPLNSIFSEKNYNSGKLVAHESVQDARTVTVNLYHDAKHPSALYVPLGQPESRSEWSFSTK